MLFPQIKLSGTSNTIPEVIRFYDDIIITLTEFKNYVFELKNECSRDLKRKTMMSSTQYRTGSQKRLDSGKKSMNLSRSSVKSKKAINQPSIRTSKYFIRKNDRFITKDPNPLVTVKKPLNKE